VHPRSKRKKSAAQKKNEKSECQECATKNVKTKKRKKGGQSLVTVLKSFGTGRAEGQQHAEQSDTNQEGQKPFQLCLGSTGGEMKTKKKRIIPRAEEAGNRDQNFL